MLPAVDVDLGPVHVGRGLGAQDVDDLGDLVGGAEAMQRLGTPEEVAKIIYVLCTETSSYVNGAEIHINGGQHV